MNKDAKALWLTALRSGEYEQSSGALKGVSEDGKVGYCCLGVLTDIAIKTGAVDGDWIYREATDSHAYRLRGGRAEGTLLPWDVAEWAGVRANGDPREDFGSEPCTNLDLPALNDGGLPFEVIANIIEKNL